MSGRCCLTGFKIMARNLPPLKAKLENPPPKKVLAKEIKVYKQQMYEVFLFLLWLVQKCYVKFKSTILCLKL